MKKFKISGVHDTPIIMMGDENHLQLYSEKEQKCYCKNFSVKEISEDPKKWAKRNVPIHPDDLSSFIYALKISQPETKKSKVESSGDYTFEYTTYMILDTIINTTGGMPLTPESVIAVAKSSPDFARKYMKNVISHIYTFKWSTYKQGSNISTVNIGSSEVDTRDVMFLEFDTKNGIDEFDISEFPSLNSVSFKTMEIFTDLEGLFQKRNARIYFDRIDMPKVFTGWDFETSYIRGWNVKIYSDEVIYYTRLNHDLRGLFLSGEKRVDLFLWDYQLYDKNKNVTVYQKVKPEKGIRLFAITNQIETLSLTDAGLEDAFDMTLLKKIVKLNLGMTPLFLFGGYPKSVQHLRTYKAPNIWSGGLENIRKLTLFSNYELISALGSTYAEDSSISISVNPEMPLLEEIETEDGFSVPNLYVKTPSLKKAKLGRSFIGWFRASVEYFEAGEFFTFENLHAEYKTLSMTESKGLQEFPEEMTGKNFSAYGFDQVKLKYLILHNPKLKEDAEWFIKRFQNLEYLEIGGKVFKGVSKPPSYHG